MHLCCPNMTSLQSEQFLMANGTFQVMFLAALVCKRKSYHDFSLLCSWLHFSAISAIWGKYYQLYALRHRKKTYFSVSCGFFFLKLILAEVSRSMKEVLLTTFLDMEIMIKCDLVNMLQDISSGNVSLC